MTTTPTDKTAAEIAKAAKGRMLALLLSGFGIAVVGFLSLLGSSATGNTYLLGRLMISVGSCMLWVALTAYGVALGMRAAHV